MRSYIGLSTTCHDPALSIINSNGEVVFCEAIERYMQNKRGWNSIPDDLNYIKKLLNKYCEPSGDIVIATSWSKRYTFQIRFLNKFLKFFKNSFSELQYHDVQNIITGMISMDNHVGKNTAFRYKQMHSGAKIIRKSYDHHLTHAAAACYSSPFNDAVCVVIDAYGEGSSIGYFNYKDGYLEKIKNIPKSAGSLGYFYSVLCTMCGWDPLKGEEWKVMGLAPYGKLDEEMYQMFKSSIPIKSYSIKRPIKQQKIFDFMHKKRRQSNTSPLLFADIAYTGQKVFSEAVLEILNNPELNKYSGNLVYTGGCALNSAVNGKIIDNTPFDDVYIFSAPADDGNALGSAMLSFYEDNPAKIKRALSIQSPYLGSIISTDTLDKAEKLGGLKNMISNGDTICQKAAELIADGKIIGWVQGKSEFGPRALGNRSILADPRDKDVKERINEKVKFREEFRPFTPSILHEYGPLYFVNYQESPYMDRALKFKKEVEHKVPGVVHVDGTGRLQTVKREWNEKYYDLITAFHKLTGIPLLLNTSFNVMGKPIMHSVEDALAVFFTSGIDALVIEDRIYVK